LAILWFLGHSIDHDIVDHLIGQSTLYHSIDLFQMLVLTRSRAKHLAAYNELSAVPSQSSSWSAMDSIPSSKSTVLTLSSSLVLQTVDYQGSSWTPGDDCSRHFPMVVIFQFQNLKIWNFLRQPWLFLPHFLPIIILKQYQVIP
jgi:hypothetical protein